jgi:hypothetical protein
MANLYNALQPFVDLSSSSIPGGWHVDREHPQDAPESNPLKLSIVGAPNVV